MTATTPTPFDIRRDLYADHFNRGLGYEEYVRTGSDRQQQRWREFEETISLTTDQTALISAFSRDLYVIFLSGVWCGDCMRQGPMMHRIAQASAGIHLRFVDNNENPELRDQLRMVGGSRVPVGLFLSEDFFEVIRFGDRSLAQYRSKALQELGPACAAGLVPSSSVLSDELAEWVAVTERAHHMVRLSPALRARHGD